MLLERMPSREGGTDKNSAINKCEVTFPLPTTAELLPGSQGGGPRPCLG